MNPEWLNVLTSLLTAFITIYFIYETRTTRKEDQNARKLAEQPQIDVFIERSDKNKSIIHLIIQNNGLTGAYNIRLFTEKGFLNKEFNSQEYNDIRNWGPFKNGIPFLPPKSKRSMVLTLLSNDYDRKMRSGFDINVSYEDSYEDKIEKTFFINFNEFENTLLTPENPIYTISDDLHSLSKSAELINNYLKRLVEKLNDGNLQRNIIFQTISEEELKNILINIGEYGDHYELSLSPFLYDTKFIIKTYREKLMMKGVLSQKDKEILIMINLIYFNDASLGSQSFNDNFVKLIQLLKLG